MFFIKRLKNIENRQMHQSVKNIRFPYIHKFLRSFSLTYNNFFIIDHTGFAVNEADFLKFSIVRIYQHIFSPPVNNRIRTYSNSYL